VGVVGTPNRLEEEGVCGGWEGEVMLRMEGEGYMEELDSLRGVATVGRCLTGVAMWLIV
jgi:hypothetical protein